MSGHSKWATIKHDKGIADAKRGKAFSRIAKMIAIAVKGGGSDNPDFNPRLRLAMEKAKEANMPKDNIDRAIDKGAGRIEGAVYESVMYEGFGPLKIAMMIECVTDNKNRTNSEIRSLFDKHGGVLGSLGSTSYFFEKKGEIILALDGTKNEEELQLELIDFGVEDFGKIENGQINVYVESTQTHEVAQKLKENNYQVLEAEVIMLPKTYIELSQAEFDRFLKFFDIIDDHEDVQKIYYNAKKI
ncbi:YebC/PmpR family DNA-binding transcriptional regulator [Candidatus Beckwithbacteria bacterium]|nr:YebC/PmpR family DNA-binding transcriptional regulator [Candidatus Beckwithbacteria bacterium]